MRPDWDHYFMKIAKTVAERSTCTRRQVGAIIVRDRIILSTGYNGAPKGIEHCNAAGCMREKLNVPSGERHELCKAVHAEQNAIIQAAVSGTSVSGGTIYTTTFPCIICSKMIINAQLKRVVYHATYSEDRAVEYFQQAGVKLINLEEDDVLYG